ncbi:MAG: CPXCG motif-containing cysteine-rich protein [Thermoanaerobaculia bacterium]|nr:CPXCG motif-containing cysteine-rich protein [Thermoanaerobaculia bacterium]
MEPLEEIEISCPYCGEPVTLAVEADLAGELVHDCEVCCNPWRVTVRRDGDGARVEAHRLDD